jgi:hypothetical protein
MNTVRKQATPELGGEAADGWVSVPKAARLLGCANPTVRTRALRGELVTQVVDGRVFVSRASVDRALAAERARPEGRDGVHGMSGT